MPNCGSQVILCDLPIRFDTYSGCSHACEYCFAKKFTDIKKVDKLEDVKALKRFVEGKRTKEYNWCDWSIPLHWGGMSDPFQPAEEVCKVSLECLKYLKETQYPFVVSSKGKLMGEEPYLSLLAECNCVVQVSLVCKSYDKIEKGCPNFEERLEIVRKLTKRCKRVIIRIQPYMCEVFNEVYENLKLFKEAGVYGVIIEGIKYQKKKPGLIKVAGDFSYPYHQIKRDFMKLRERAHELGLKIYAGENRLRIFGDSLTCCGIDGLEGFKANDYNINHLINGDITKPTENMLNGETGRCFHSLYMDGINYIRNKGKSFSEEMIYWYKTHKKMALDIFGKNIRG